jgi:hypothetical protein
MVSWFRECHLAQVIDLFFHVELFPRYLVSIDGLDVSERAPGTLQPLLLGPAGCLARAMQLPCSFCRMTHATQVCRHFENFSSAR